MFEDYKSYIISEFEKRKVKNSSYSMTAYARDLGINQPTLSRLLNGKIGISTKKAMKMAQKMNLTDEEISVFVLLVQAKHARSLNQKKSALEHLKKLNLKMLFGRMEDKTFSGIYDWTCWAIFFLLDVEGFKQDPKWISNRIGILQSDVEEALKKLFASGILYNKNGKWMKLEKFPTIQSRKGSSIIRNHHRQILNRAERALDHVDANKRSFWSFHFAINESDYEEFKTILEESILYAMSKINNKTKKSNKVYTTAIQFFPLEQKL